MFLHFVHWALSSIHFTISTHTTCVEMSVLWHSVHKFVACDCCTLINPNSICTSVVGWQSCDGLLVWSSALKFVCLIVSQGWFLSFWSVVYIYLCEISLCKVIALPLIILVSSAIYWWVNGTGRNQCNLGHSTCLTGYRCSLDGWNQEDSSIHHLVE